MVLCPLDHDILLFRSWGHLAGELFLDLLTQYRVNQRDTEDNVMAGLCPRPRVGEVSCCQCLTGRRLLVVIKDILVQNLLGAHDGVRLAEWFGEKLAETEEEDEAVKFWSDHVGLQGQLAKENLKGLMVRREIYISGVY